MKRISMVLTVFSLAVSLFFSACASQTGAVSLAGTSWKLASYGPVSAPVAAAPGIETKLVFGADGKLSGNLGCNGFSGDYSVEGGKLTFGPLMATLMACPEPQMSQEGTAFLVLKDSATFTISADTLTITSLDKSTLLTLTKQ